MAKIEYLSPQQLAELIGLPVSTIYSFNSDGTGPRRIRVGKRVRYRLADVEAWLNDHEVGDTRGDAMPGGGGQ